MTTRPTVFSILTTNGSFTVVHAQRFDEFSTPVKENFDELQKTQRKAFRHCVSALRASLFLF